ncbi:alpha/beta hydrolase [Novosphingobium sp.]|uniref:alpha/beta hydrolase n=1 Tax=Novosphingobium sp. TaxID=1874826 RepID=UPI003D129364
MAIYKPRGALSGRAALAAAALAVSACSPLHLFNGIMPKDGGSAQVGSVDYGPLPRQGLDIYAPTKAHAGPLPVIVFIYGGSWNSGDRGGYAFVGRALAARGYVVVIPDYRLVPQVHYPAFLQDNAAAVHWVRQHVQDYGGDPARLVLMGHSAGAYNAAMLAFDPRWLGADRAALRGFIGLAGPYDFLPLAGPETKAAFADTADLASTQPVNHASADAPPSLLATADKDTLVRPLNSDAMAKALTAHGVAVTRVRYPNIGHVGLITSVAKPLRSKAPVLEDAIRFADQVTAQK